MQLPLFKKTRKDIATMSIREKWAYFFRYASETNIEDLDEIAGKDQALKRAYDELASYRWSEMELNNYESAEMKQAADQAVLEAAFEQGAMRGEMKKSKEVAKVMIQEGFSIDQISKITSLPKEDLEAIRMQPE